MPLANDVRNYLVGKGRVYFRKAGETGFVDLGNVPKFDLAPEVTQVDHYSSRSGTKKKDLTIVTEKKATIDFELEEYSSENLNFIFLGQNPVSGSQTKGNLDAVEKTVPDNQFVDLGKIYLSSVKIAHGTVTGGPFQKGETVTGGTSTATGKIVWGGSGFIEIISLTGTFAANETITGGTSHASASANAVTVQEDVIVTDDDTTPTKRYVLGIDYRLDAKGGLFEKLESGSITTSCFISADYALKSTISINALEASTVQGEMKFIGDPDQGPVCRVNMWLVTLKVSGKMPLISDDISKIAMTAEILADEINHPDNPFFEIVQVN